MGQLGIIAELVDLSVQACHTVGPIAQSVEQRTFNLWVVGSIPTGPTRSSKCLICPQVATNRGLMRRGE